MNLNFNIAKSITNNYVRKWMEFQPPAICVLQEIKCDGNEIEISTKPDFHAIPSCRLWMKQLKSQMCIMKRQKMSILYMKSASEYSDDVNAVHHINNICVYDIENNHQRNRSIKMRKFWNFPHTSHSFHISFHIWINIKFCSIPNKIDVACARSWRYDDQYLIMK